jgi:hypothetical protein
VRYVFEPFGWPAVGEKKSEGLRVAAVAEAMFDRAGVFVFFVSVLPGELSWSMDMFDWFAREAAPP